MPLHLYQSLLTYKLYYCLELNIMSQKYIFLLLYEDLVRVFQSNAIQILDTKKSCIQINRDFFVKIYNTEKMATCYSKIPLISTLRKPKERRDPLHLSSNFACSFLQKISGHIIKLLGLTVS